MSRIKVDALQGTSGSDTAITLSGANPTVGGPLAVTGVHTVGTNAIYTSDNGAVTQSVVQSLVKGWVFGSSAAALNDSHNIASGTDNGTGDYTYAHTNNYNITTYANAGNVNTDARRCQYVRDIQTSSIRVRHWHEDGGYADCSQATLMAGDLA